MPSTDTGSQGPIFWERLLKVFKSSTNGQATPGDDPHRPLVMAFCLALSLVLWLVATLGETRTVMIDIPTTVANLSSEQALTELPPSTVDVEVEGQGLQLLILYGNRPQAALDASSGTVDVRNSLTLAEASNLNIVSVSPQQINVPTEPRIERRVPVRSRLDLDLAPSHELLGPVRLRPDSVTISGAQSIVESFSKWPTEERVVKNVRDSVSTNVALSDTLEALVDRSITSVQATALAGRFTEDSVRIDVEVSGVPSDQNLVALEPPTITVTYRILFDQMFDAKTASGFFATVPYEKIRSDTSGYVRPEISVPSDLQIRDPQPSPSRLRYYTFLTGE